MRHLGIAALLLTCVPACGDDGPPDGATDIQVIGRFDGTDPEAPRFAWPGTAVAARFTGTSLSATFEDAGANQFDVVIDDGEPQLVIPGPGAVTLTLADGLADGAHDVRITRRTEGLFGVTTFRGFGDAELTPRLPDERRIELVGDGITCGAGVLGADGACPFSSDTEAATHAWGALAAAALDADYAVVAASDLGAYRNDDGTITGTMADLYARALPDEDAAWTFDDGVDVVVVALGAADFATGDPGQPFVAAMFELVGQIRARRPDAYILLALSPMLTDDVPIGGMHATLARGYLQDVADAADARVQYLELAAQDPVDGVGCAGYPNEVTHQRMADVLVAKIHDVTGW